MPSPVVVVGGRGIVGRHAMRSLEAMGIPAVATGRSPSGDDLCLDFARPATFSAVDPFEHILLVADGDSSEFVKYACAKGKRVFEASADMRVVARLLDLDGGGWPGALVVGVGLFPGLLELLAADTEKLQPCGARTTAAVSVSPLSGAGRATVALMGSAMASPYVTWEDGERVEHPPMRRVPDVPFGGRAEPALGAPMADSLLLRRSSRAPTLRMAFAPRPRILAIAFGLMPVWLVRARWFQSATVWGMTLLRRVILRSRKSLVKLHVSVDARSRLLATSDGMLATGQLCAVMVALDRARARGTGVMVASDAFGLDEVLARSAELPDADVRLVEG